MRTTLRTLIKTREDIQSLRKQIDNRLGLKADGSPQSLDVERAMNLEDYDFLLQRSKNLKEEEKIIEKQLNKVLKQHPIYNEFLYHVKGIGNVNAGFLIAEYDIHEATTPSKMWQYGGMNPGLVPGKKRMAKKDYKPEMGEIVKEIKNQRTKETDVFVQTNTMVRGDKATPGFLLPYNKNLKTRLLGIIADGFIKAQNDYALNFYYPYKYRLENSEQITKEVKKGGKIVEIPWKDCTKGHRDQAAKRFMIKQFVKDLYAEWRAIEGLEVRKPYDEDYLGNDRH